MTTYKYGINTIDKIIKHSNNKIYLEVEILNECELKLNTNVQIIYYYFNIINNKKKKYDYIPDSYSKILYNDKTLGLLFNNKSLDTIIKKLYEECIINIQENDIKYIFKYVENKDKLYYTPIVNFFCNNKQVFELIIDMLENIIMHNKANDFYKPRPEYIKNITISEIISESTIYSKEQVISTLLSMHSNLLNIDELLIEDNKYRFEIEKELFYENPLSYHILLISIIEFNKYYLQLFKVQTITDNIKIYKVDYNDKSISEKFDLLIDKETKNIGWHGSNILNWYSILYNGLVAGNSKNGTIVNGAAYGEGIYISDTLNYSINYSYRPNLNKCDKTHNNNIIIGLFQINGGLEKYKKTNQIFVVPNSDLLCLRYLVVGNKTTISKNISKLDTYFIKSHTQIKKEEKEIAKKKGNGRIIKEIKMMYKYNEGPVDDNGLTLEFNILDDQINIWRCKLNADNFKECNDLYSDLQTYNINCIEFEILLPESYPFEPPFIRLVYPRFTFLSGHITRGGSICMELLTKQGWTSSISIDKVLLMIKQNMMDGNARIDTTLLGKSYGYKEAVEAYDRMLRNHPEWTSKRK